MIFFQFIKSRNYILITENFASDVLEILRSLFLWKEVIKMMGILVVSLLNEKWEENLTATLNYITGCDWWNVLQNESAKDKLLLRFPNNSIYKTIPLFIEVRFFDGKVKVPIITFLTILNFRLAYLLTIFQLICCKEKKTPIRKTIIKIPW